MSVAMNGLILWDYTSGQIYREYLVTNSEPIDIFDVAWDTRQFLYVTDDVVNIVDMNTGETIYQFNGHFTPIRTARFDKQGERVASADNRGSILVWNSKTGQIIRRYDGHDDLINDLTFLNSSQGLLSTSWLNQLILWQYGSLADLQDWIISNRYLPELSCSHRELYNLVNCSETITKVVETDSVSNIQDEHLTSPTPRVFDAEIAHNPEDNRIEVYQTQYTYSNFMMEFAVKNGFGADEGPWDFGLFFRWNNKEHYRLIITSDGIWRLQLDEFETSQVLQSGEISTLYVNENEENLIYVEVVNDVGHLFINDEFISELDISALQQFGDISIGVGFYSEHEREGGITHINRIRVEPIDEFILDTTSK